MRWMLLVVLLAGCPPPQEGNLLLDERFEDEAAFRAAWQVTGEVTFETTYHPAEHALVAHGAVTLSGPLAYTVYDPSEDGEWLEYSTPCLGEPELWWEGTVLHVSIPAAEQLAWRRVHANLPPITDVPTTVDGIVIELDDPAATCPIDNLRVYQPAPLW